MGQKGDWRLISRLKDYYPALTVFGIVVVSHIFWKKMQNVPGLGDPGRDYPHRNVNTIKTLIHSTRTKKSYLLSIYSSRSCYQNYRASLEIRRPKLLNEVLHNL